VRYTTHPLHSEQPLFSFSSLCNRHILFIYHQQNSHTQILLCNTLLTHNFDYLIKNQSGHFLTVCPILFFSCSDVFALMPLCVLALRIFRIILLVDSAKKLLGATMRTTSIQRVRDETTRRVKNSVVTFSQTFVTPSVVIRMYWIWYCQFHVSPKMSLTCRCFSAE